MAFITENGVITFKSPVASGVSKSSGNAWQSQTIVVSRDGVNAPYDKVALRVTGDKVVQLSEYRVGDKVEVVYSVNAREYNGNWYNELNLYKISGVDTRRPSAAAQPAQAPEPTPNPEIFGNMDEELPF